jgi:hypothetical protein
VRPAEQLLVELADAFAVVPRQAEGLEIAIDEIRLDLPVEARIVRGGALELSLPRGMMATGFGFPHGRLRMRLTGGEG